MARVVFKTRGASVSRFTPCARLAPRWHRREARSVEYGRARRAGRVIGNAQSAFVCDRRLAQRRRQARRQRGLSRKQCGRKRDTRISAVWRRASKGKIEVAVEPAGCQARKWGSKSCCLVHLVAFSAAVTVLKEKRHTGLKEGSATKRHGAVVQSWKGDV